jgi:CheY-like chemotaxis protein
MDPFSLLVSAVAFAGAEVAKKCGSLVIDQAFQGVSILLKKTLGGKLEPEDLTPERLRTVHMNASSAFAEQAQAVVAQSSALRRAQLVHPVLKGARVLWVDDQPRNIAYECQALIALGVAVELAVSTDAALAKVRQASYDVILSDMARDRPDAGLVLLRMLREVGCPTEVVFYVGQVDKGKGVPAGAFGITNQPEPLLHYVLDVLERSRV